MDKLPKYIVGIDEVGRGPIAGPVAVCAFVMREDFVFSGPEYDKLPKLKDSKKLSPKQRESWFEFLKKQKDLGQCDYAVSFVSSENIDKFGIVKCIQKALNESLFKIASQDYLNFSRFTPEGMNSKLLCDSSGLEQDHLYERKRIDNKGNYTDKNLDNLASLFIYLDGGLKAPVEYINQETIIRGDELHPVISMASIMAKVSRDRIMTKFALEYPGYGFENHVGYGTKAHYEAIKKHGQISIHRKTFIH